MIALEKVRKVRASQGRMPDNVWREQSQDKCNRNKPPKGKGEMAV